MGIAKWTWGGMEAQRNGGQREWNGNRGGMLYLLTFQRPRFAAPVWYGLVGWDGMGGRMGGEWGIRMHACMEGVLHRRYI